MSHRVLWAVLVIGFSTAVLAATIDTDRDGIPDGADAYPDDITLPGYTPMYTFDGGATQDYFGMAVSNAGDVNKDGYDDIIVGAYGDDIGTYGGYGYMSGGGSVRVISGKDGNTLYLFNGKTANDGLGYNVSAAGDVNNDGYADLAVNSRRGYSAATVISGKNGNTLYTFFKGVTNGAGDVNNDGYDDIIVGMNPADTTNASVRVYSGANGSTLYTFPADAFNDEFGFAVSGAGDVNNDGYDDVIVGAVYDDNNGDASGSVRVFSGANGAVLYNFYGDTAGTMLGRSVSAAGDVNNDGYDDVIVGGHGAGTNGSYSGVARVYSGMDGSILYTFNGDSAGAMYGYSVSAAGDIDHDGYADVIVGSATSPRVYSGIDGHILYTFTAPGVGNFGAAVSGGGDIDNDGYADLVVGAPDADFNGTDSGRIYVFSGAAYVENTRDTDGDGQMDVLDADDDNDGALDVNDVFPRDASESADNDNDGIGNNADPSDDGDAVNDAIDNCPSHANDDQANYEGDAQGDICDADDDNDAVLDEADKFPHDATESSDNDKDGVGDNADLDDDNDVKADVSDNCPWIANANQVNNDGDAQGDACDNDDDNDGVVDASDEWPTNKLYQVDTDRDTLPDNWEVAHGRNPAVADYAIGPACVKGESGGDCAASSSMAVVTVTQNIAYCSTVAENIVRTYTPTADGVSFKFVYNKPWLQYDAGLGYSLCYFSYPIENYIYPRAADHLVQFTARSSTPPSEHCFLDRQGFHCYSDRKAIALPTGATIDSDGDGIPRPIDPLDLDATESVDSDGDQVGDNSDNCPTIANNTQLNSDGDLQGDACDEDDGDGMPDAWELQHGLNPSVNDANGDLDGDGISNKAEYDNHTDPDVFTAPTKVKNDYTKHGKAGWIWKGVANGHETETQIWQLTFPLVSNNFAVPTRFYPPAFADQGNWELATTGDFNKDGDADFLWRHKITGEWKRIWQIENGTRKSQNNLPGLDMSLDWQVAGAGDTDSDGDDDVILVNSNTSEVMIMEMESYAIEATHPLGGNANYTLSRIGDFNKDGDVDLLFRQNGSDVLVIWEIENNSLVAEHALANTGNGYNPVCAGDFDKDGDDDILLLNSSTKQEKWFVMENYTRTQQFGGTNTGFVLLGCGDYDGDGDTDTLWQRSADDMNRIVLQQNWGASKQTVYTNPFGGVNPGNAGYGFEHRGNKN